MVTAVSFERYGRLYYLDAGDLTPKVGDKVLFPTEGGTEVAECVWAPQWVDDEIGGLPRLAGLAGDDDVRRDETNRRRRAEAKVAAKKLIRSHDLPMKVVGVDYLDRGEPRKFVVYFSAPHRVDFRELVRDMSRTRSRKSTRCGAEK
ncbi:MAG: hypothetical protein QOD07_404, partial [Frankiaceae bacterium]|nr:hypothetical protein [Frankiaceae bacterium]